jgi:putative ABC transport system permease protein
MRVLDDVRVLVARAGELFRRRDVARELDEEFRFHLDCEIAHRVARGVSPADARRQALLAFGGVHRFREETRDARGFARVDAFVRDLRFAVRRLRRAPAFTAGAVATLGVGLGVAGGIGAVVYGVMLRPLPYPESDRLVRVALLTPGLGVTVADHSPGTFVFLAERARSFSALGAYMENRAVSITEGDAPERVPAALLTPNVLRLLGTVPAAGRLLTDDDAAAGFTSPVMISFDLWQRRYGGDSRAVGRFIELNRGRRLIAGVLPRGFAFPSPHTAIYYPDRIEATRATLAYRSLTVVGRLAPGVSVEAAQREADALMPRLGERFPDVTADTLRRAGLRATVATLRDAMVAPVRPELRLLAALVGVLLLIAVANVATLSLLRAERLHVEVAVVRALGASAGALRQRFAAESMVAALAGGATAIPIAALTVITKLGFTDEQIPRLGELAVTPALVAGMLGAAVIIGLTLGTIMAARAGRGAEESLRADVRATPARGWRRVQTLLVSAQLALAMALLVAAGLMTASVLRLRRVDLGFAAADGAQFSVQIPFRGYETYQRTAAFDLSVIDALARTPGVTGAAGAMELPSMPQLLDIRPTLEATRADGTRGGAIARINVVSAGFFRLMGIPLRAGREFAAGDLAASTPAVVLGAALARDLFAGADPIGREVRFASGRYPAYRVVGVSGDVYGDRVTDGALRSVYFPLLDDLTPGSTETENRIPVMPGGMHFVVRSQLPLETLAPAFRAAVRSVDPRVPVWDVRTLDDVVASTTARLRLSMLLLLCSSAATMLLGAIGIYSVVAYATAGRAPEFAVRLALGATPRGLARLVYREGALMVAVGLVAGVVLSLITGRIVGGMLYEVRATDARVFAASAVAVALIAVGAMYAPARRAGTADPAAVLRGR